MIAPNYVPSVCDLCGNGIRTVGLETCDDGIKNDGRGCTGDCLGVVPGWYCTLNLTTLKDQCNSVCGDGIIANLEVCDDGKGGCLDDCSGPKVGFECNVGANGLTECLFDCTIDDSCILTPEEEAFV